MRYTKAQAGFTAIELVLVVVVLGLIGFTAVKAYDARNVASRDQAPTVQSAKLEAVPAAPVITTDAELSTAASVLDSIDVDENSSDSSELDADLASF